jgi:hypothetical protein
MVILAAVLGGILRRSKLVGEHKALPVHAFAVYYFVVGYPDAPPTCPLTVSIRNDFVIALVVTELQTEIMSM